MDFPVFARGITPQGLFFYLYLVQSPVPLWRQQTFGGSEQCAHSVAFDGASFENEIEAVYILAFQGSGFYRLFGDLIIQLGSKFQSPAVECKVEQGRGAGVYHGDGSVVACPCVIGGTFQKADVVHVDGSSYLLFHFFRFGGDNQ